MLLATAKPVTGMSSGSRSRSSLSSDASLSEAERNESRSEKSPAPLVRDAPRERGARRSNEVRPCADVSAGANEGGRVTAGCAMASPDAASADARPPGAAAEFLRGGERPVLLPVAERGTGGGPGLEGRRQGRRFLLVALLTE